MLILAVSAGRTDTRLIECFLKFLNNFYEIIMSTQLESWNDGATKSSIMEFVTKVTTENDPDYLLPADRIATFDNDGTLWVEVPAPPQYDFQIRKWIKEAQKDPSLASEEPYKAILEQDKAFLRLWPSRIQRWWPRFKTRLL